MKIEDKGRSSREWPRSRSKIRVIRGIGAFEGPDWLTVAVLVPILLLGLGCRHVPKKGLTRAEFLASVPQSTIPPWLKQANYLAGPYQWPGYPFKLRPGQAAEFNVQESYQDLAIPLARFQIPGLIGKSSPAWWVQIGVQDRRFYDRSGKLKVLLVLWPQKTDADGYIVDPKTPETREEWSTIFYYFYR